MQIDQNDNSEAPSSKDLRFQFQMKLQHLLEKHPHLNHSGRRCMNKVLRSGGGSGDVYEAILWIGESRIKVALKQMRSYMLKDDKFAKV